METKKFISTLKGFRTRFTKTPNEELERKSVSGLIEKFGKEQSFEAVKEDEELKQYLDKVTAGHIEKKEEPLPAAVTPAVTSTPAVTKVTFKRGGEEFTEINGVVYKIDTVTKTMKRVYHDFKELAKADIDVISEAAMPMKVYQRYLQDRFSEDAPIKRGKLVFKGYRISCTATEGFIVEDTFNHYALVETPFDGIPTPKELGDWISGASKKLIEGTAKGSPKKVETPNVKEPKKSEIEETPDFETLRRKVLRMIERTRTNSAEIDPEQLITIIPFKRWKRNAKSLYTQWKNRKIRYSKFLSGIAEITTNETFVVEEKRHRSSFTGTLLPEHKTVGMLVGDKIEVDGKWIEAVPFLLEYLLFYEKRVMSQIMKYAQGEITEVELLNNPMEVDWKVEYKKRALANTAHNARLLCMVYEQVGIVAPQDLLYEADLQVGDKILLCNDGTLQTRTIMSVEQGINLSKGEGLLKLDKWIKLPQKETK